MTLPWKQVWQKKLDGLLCRVRRAGTARLEDLESPGLIKKVRDDRTIDVDEALADPAVAEFVRRQSAIMGEHELRVFVLGCFVTMIKLPGGKVRLGVSWADGRPHGMGNDWTPPEAVQQDQEISWSPRGLRGSWARCGALGVGAGGIRMNAILGRLRAAGWSVAVHNDYRLAGKASTFWLLTHPTGVWIKGEGATDEAALKQAEVAAPGRLALVEPHRRAWRVYGASGDQEEG